MSGLDIESVLSAHQYRLPFDSTGAVVTTCTCKPFKLLFATAADHRAHVAAVLREQIDGALAEAWDEGLSVGSVAGYYGPRNPRNPYRAAHLSDTERAGDAG